MGELLVVAFLGGLITGLSPCIVPVIPVVMAGGSSSTNRARPYLIIAGIVSSFSLSVLFASSVLELPRTSPRTSCSGSGSPCSGSSPSASWSPRSVR